MRTRGAEAYKRVSIESASPVRLLDEFYLRLLRDIGDARRFIAVRDIPQKGMVISHALAIVSELIAALDFTVAPQLCGELKRLYTFVNDRLIKANLMIDAEPLDAAEKTIITLRDAFREVVNQ